MNAIETITLTVTGDTYKARTWLKENGWKWDADSKSWSKGGLTQATNVYGVDGFALANGAWIGNIESIRSSIKCHAKSDRFELVAE